jgi:hypothetical protein
MAYLTEQAKLSLWAEVMSAASARRESIGALSKEELREAIDALDVWLDEAVASFFSAVPAAACEALSTKQQFKLLFAVVKKRLEAD